MPERLDGNLVDLAYEVVALNGRDKQIDFGEGTDYQGKIYLSWDGSKFQAWLTVFSDPVNTNFFSFYNPPETIWREEGDEYETIKIRDVADWLKRDWGFVLAPTNPPNNGLHTNC